MSPALAPARAPHLAGKDGEYSLKNRPVFAVGKWNGEEYSKKDLAHLVEAFEPLLLEVKPYIKIGHDDDQKAVKDSPSSSKWAQRDGEPVAGFITGLRLNSEYTDDRTGEKVEAGTRVLADFGRMPKVLADALEAGRYNSLSAEILVGYEDTRGKKWPMVLRGVAFLGADLPAVRVLEDVARLNSEEEQTRLVATFSGHSDGRKLVTFAAQENHTMDEMREALAKIQELLAQLLQAVGEPPKEEEPMEPEPEEASVEEASEDEEDMGMEELEVRSKEKDKMAEGQDEEEEKDFQRPRKARRNSESKPSGKAIPKPESFSEMERKFASLRKENEELQRQVMKIVSEREEAERSSRSQAVVQEFADEARIPPRMVGVAAFLRSQMEAFAPKVRKFSHGDEEMTLVDAFDALLRSLPENTRLFTRQTKSTSEPRDGNVAERVRKLAEEKAKKESKPFLVAYKEVQETLSPEEFAELHEVQLG